MFFESAYLACGGLQRQHEARRESVADSSRGP
jgi:hypothetical protein